METWLGLSTIKLNFIKKIEKTDCLALFM